MVYSEAIFSRLALERVLLISFAARSALAGSGICGRAGRHPAVPASARHDVRDFHMASILYMDRLSPPDAKNLARR